jgi:hypothetical protein
MQPAREWSRTPKGPLKQRCAGCAWVVGNSIATIQAGRTGQSQQHAKANQGRVSKLLPHTVIIVKQNLAGFAQAIPQRLAMPVGTPGGECCTLPHCLSLCTVLQITDGVHLLRKVSREVTHLLASALTNKVVCMWRLYIILHVP